MNWQEVKFRASAIGTLMTEPRSKSEQLSATTKSELRKIFREKKYGIKKVVKSKYFTKGNMSEEDGITLLSRNDLCFYAKNTLRLQDDMFSGEPDIITGTQIIDIKSSWDAFTFPFPNDELSKEYKAQGQIYMHLTGLKSAVFAFTLIDTPEFLIQKEIDSIKWETGEPATEEQAAFIRNNLTFSDKFSVQERVCKFTIEYDEDFINQVKYRVPIWRNYLQSLER